MDTTVDVPGTEAGVDPIARLRLGTAAYHVALERELPLLADNLDLFTYRSVLECFFGLYAPLEASLGKLRPCLAEFTDFEQRWKLPLLMQDLTALGVRLTEVELWQDRRPPESCSQALGVMYVLEGATLGGQIIARHVRERLHLSEANGAAFLHGYGCLTGPRWQEFLSVARRLLGGQPEASEAVDSAGRTFKAFLFWSRRCGLAQLPGQVTISGANQSGPAF